MPETFELLHQMAPNRHEKRRVQRVRGLKSEDSIYKECSDSGRRNPLDNFLVYVDHALAHHPDAALAAAQFVMHRVSANLSFRAQTMPLAELVAALQPGSEKEAMEAVRALSTGLRQLLLGGECDAPALLRELEEAVRELTKMALMLRASMQAEVAHGAA